MTQFRPASAVVVVLLGSLGIVSPGCGSGGPAKPTNETVAQAGKNPWSEAADSIRTSHDAAGCRRALAQLNGGLAVAAATDQPAGLSAEQAAALKAVVPLSDADLAAVSGASYTPLDGHYLAQSLHLRDAMKGLADNGDPAAAASAAFAWVSRHVERRPWVVGEVRQLANGSTAQVRFSPCLPPEYVLRRGSGNPLERAYVFLAAVQQLGLDGCLVGPPAARTTPATVGTTGPTVSVGPFWAVGVRAGKDILLFDPDHGRPFPSADGKGVGTLAGIQADPSLLDPWTKDADRPWKLSPDQVKASTAFLAVPLSALAPRMAVLNKRLPAEFGVRLAVDPAALKHRFQAETGTADVSYWNPDGAEFTFTRTLATFLPLDEGGRDGTPPSDRLYEKFQFSLLPASLFALPDELLGRERARYEDLTNRLGSIAATPFLSAYVDPPSPRVMIQRGQYFAATSVLVGRKQEFEAMLQRARSDRNAAAEADKWLGEIRQLYDDLSRARIDQDSNPTALSVAKNNLESFWRSRGNGGVALVDVALGEAGVAEGTYLIALAKTEEAYRARGREPGVWADAADWWQRYLRIADGQESSFPGRSAHANAVLADVLSQQGKAQ